MMRVDLLTATTLLERQWRTLRAWLDVVLDDEAFAAYADSPSAIEGFTVLELVAHIGRALDALVATRPAEPGAVPLTLAEYLGTYPDRAAEVARVTHELALAIAPDPLRAVDRTAEEAFERLRELGPDDRVVQARRAPIALSDMVVSRLVELVLHADDLARSVPARPGERPLDPEAVEFVAQALLGIVVTRGGWSLELEDPLLWIRLATGRVAYDVDQLALAVRARFTSDSVPDLNLMLPLL